MGKIVKLKNANNVYTYPITKTEAVYIEDNKTTLKDYLDATAIIKTAEPAQMVTFNDGANNIPIKSCIVNLEPYQEGTGEPSPTNIRPISGQTGLTVTAANKNLAPNYAGTASTTSNGITFTYNDDGSITLNGTATASAYSRAVDGIAGNIRRPYGTYKKPVAAFGNHYVGLFVQYQKSTSSWESVTGGGVASDTFTLDEDYPLAIRIGVTAGTTVDNYRFEPYIYLDSVNDLTWVSPTKTDIPITWASIAGTVYSGTLDVLSGLLTVDRVCIEMDGTTDGHKMTAMGTYGNLAVAYAIFPGGRIFGTNMQPSKAVATAAGALSSHMPYGNIASDTTLAQTPKAFYYRINATNQFQIRIYDEGKNYTDINSWLVEQKTAGTPVQITMPLETPQTYQLTPTEVRTLLGSNTIYTDAGNVSVKYIADTKLYIDEKIAELQALTPES